MKITTTMNLDQLAQRMSRDVDVAAEFAYAMRDLLIEYGYEGQDTTDITESNWLAMIDMAVGDHIRASGYQWPEKKMKAIMVKYNGGYYETIGAATEEDFDEVKENAERVERIESLTGWGKYTAAYRVVTADGFVATYFVDESDA